MTKKETFATAPITVTKVSSEHMTSGIAAVMTLPCSGLLEKTLTGGLPFTPLYHFY